MGRQTDGRAGGPTNERTDGGMNGQTSEQMDKQTNGRTNERKDKLNKRIDIWASGQKDRWKDALKA